MGIKLGSWGERVTKVPTDSTHNLVGFRAGSQIIKLEFRSRGDTESYLRAGGTPARPETLHYARIDGHCNFPDFRAADVQRGLRRSRVRDIDPGKYMGAEELKRCHPLGGGQIKGS